jgi:hypothetical protein
MTGLEMLDSVTVADLPDGADAYLGYPFGDYVTWPELVARFGGRAHLLSMAVEAGQDAEGCDCETGDLTAAQVVPWVARQLGRGVWRPVVYRSVSGMAEIVAGLAKAGISRASVRLLTAHYDWRPDAAGKHICGPATCAWEGVPACDGTQWTDQAAGVGGSHIDESLLADDFFGQAEKSSARKEAGMVTLTSGKRSVAIPRWARVLHFASQDSRDVTVDFHGGRTDTRQLTWEHGSAWVEVPAGVFAAVVQVSGHGADVAMVFEE